VTHILIVVVLLLLTGCTSLRQCSKFSPGAEHDACVQKAYSAAADASMLTAGQAYYQR